MALEAACQAILTVARAAGHAHAEGIIHRDIKPGNVLIANGNVLKLADFGLAKAAAALHSRDNIIAGTPAYMAPEQLAGAPANPHADLYSLGVVLFELLSLHRPIEAPNLGQWLRRISQEPATPLQAYRPDLKGPLCELVDQLLQREPAQRPASCDEVADRLAGVLQMHRSLLLRTQSSP